MKNLFDGLGDLGFDNLDDLEPFKVKENAPETVVTITSNIVSVEECLFDKSYDCPVCDKKFKQPSVKTSKARFIELDTDLMPKYTPVYPFYYNVTICPSCGYAALAENFLKITDSQCTLIKRNITPKFTSKTYKPPYSEDVAIERYKYALLNSLIKKGRVSERAYICLVISWIYKIKGDEENRLLFAKNAYEAFVDAYSKESFPLYGMNEVVTAYLVAMLAYIVGENENALKWTGTVLTARQATQKVKDMALELKTTLLKAKAIKKAD